jgi:purine-binding chemotaxis protein CheW
VEEVQEIVPMAELARPPGLPSLLEGFLNLRGSAVPILRLDRLFQLPLNNPGLYTPLVILRSIHHPTGLMVDRVTGVFSAPEEACLPVRQKHCFNDCVEAEFVLEPDGGPIHVLSPERLLLHEERCRLAELQATAQQHLTDLERPCK